MTDNQTPPDWVLIEAAKAQEIIEAQAAEIEFHKERADASALQADEWEGKYLIGIAEIERLREALAAAYIELSGKEEHASDCATSNAPAMMPGRCDCD